MLTAHKTRKKQGGTASSEQLTQAEELTVRAWQWQLSRHGQGHHCLFSNAGAVKVHRFHPRISSLGKKHPQNNKQRWRATLHLYDQSHCHVYMLICMADSSAGKQELQFAWTYQHFNYCPALKLAELPGDFQPRSWTGWDWGKLKAPCLEPRVIGGEREVGARKGQEPRENRSLLVN